MANGVRSTNIAELQRMFSNLDSNVISSVLAANNGQVDLTIDHLLTMSIDTETTNNIHQSIPTVPLRQLPAVANLYEDDPPPYPGLESSSNIRSGTFSQPPNRPSRQAPPSISNRSSPVSQRAPDPSPPRDIQVQKWKTPYGQYRVCYTGDLSADFLRVTSLHSNVSNSNEKTAQCNSKNQQSNVYSEDEYLALLLQNQEFLFELRQNKDFLNTLRSDQPPSKNLHTSQRRSSNQFSTKPLPLPEAPIIETPKTPKVRARMLQNVLTQIEQGQTTRTSMVPEPLIIDNEGYSYGPEDKARTSLPPAPSLTDGDSLRAESNEEFIARLKNMGKTSMEKFNQLARRFSMRKGSTLIDSFKTQKPSTFFNRTDHQRLSNDLDNDDSYRRMNNND